MGIRWTIKEDNYDSVLEPAQSGHPAKLTIRLKVDVFPKDPSRHEDRAAGQYLGYLSQNADDIRTGWVEDANHNIFKCRSWLVKEFNEFKITFKRMVELSWNNQMILLPPNEIKDGDGLTDRDYLQFVGKPEVPAHIRCALDIQLMPLGPAPVVIEAARLDTRQDHRFRSFQRLITNEDVEFTTSRDYHWPSLAINQVAAAHEVGHWLGGVGSKTDENRYLQHVDAEYCSTLPEDQKDDECEYGHTGGKRIAMMGAGTLVTEYEARPWLTRIQRHTHALFGWTTVHRVHFESGNIPVSERQQRLTKTAHK